MVFRFSGDEAILAEGDNYLWLGCQLRADTNLDAAIEAECRAVTIEGLPPFATPEAKSRQRTGVALRQGGDDGVHT